MIYKRGTALERVSKIRFDSFLEVRYKKQSDRRPQVKTQRMGIANLRYQPAYLPDHAPPIGP